jgi:hypothetical protein
MGVTVFEMTFAKYKICHIMRSLHHHPQRKVMMERYFFRGIFIGDCMEGSNYLVIHSLL